MSRRLRPPQYKGGQGRNVALPIGQAYTPMTWDESEQRIRDLLAYEPNESPERWAAHREVVIDLVARTDFFGRLRDRHLMGTFHQFFVYAQDRGWSTDPESLLCGDRIDTFVSAVYEPRSRPTHRWRLRHVAAVVFPPPPQAIGQRFPAHPPHTPQERARFLAGANDLIAGHCGDLAKRREMKRDIDVALALSFGAGCDGKAVHRVHESWLSEVDEVLWLQRPDRDVPIPIREPWAQMLRDAMSGTPDAWLLRPAMLSERGSQLGKVLFKARKVSPVFKGFDCDRAARLWQVELLQSAGIADVAALIGTRPGSSMLADLTAHLARSSDARFRSVALGWLT